MKKQQHRTWATERHPHPQMVKNNNIQRDRNYNSNQIGKIRNSSRTQFRFRSDFAHHGRYSLPTWVWELTTYWWLVQTHGLYRGVGYRAFWDP